MNKTRYQRLREQKRCTRCREQKAEHYQKKKTAGAATPNGQDKNHLI